MTIPTIEQTVARMKREILAEMDAGTIPRNVSSFSELHDYIDANELGGFCDDKIASDLCVHFGGYDWWSEEYDNSGLPEGMMDYINKCQYQVDEWLSSQASI
jgi:hypothetical protein